MTFTSFFVCLHSLASGLMSIIGKTHHPIALQAVGGPPDISGAGQHISNSGVIQHWVKSTVEDPSFLFCYCFTSTVNSYCHVGNASYLITQFGEHKNTGEHKKI